MATQAPICGQTLTPVRSKPGCGRPGRQAIISDVSRPALHQDPTPAFDNILCGIDDSRPSAEAARQAIALAAPGGAVEFVAVGYTVGEGRRAVSSINPDRLKEALAGASRDATLAGARATQKTLSAADPSAALLEEAPGHDLVAVGSYSGSRTSGILFGSTASTLAHRAPVPVLIARRPPAAVPFPGGVLVASDGSPGSTAAARLAGRVARACRSAVTIVHVSDGQTPEMRGELARQTVELTEITGQEPAFCDASGDAHVEIPRLAGELESALLVIGSRGLGGLKALGSVSERVAHEAPCSVLLARGPA
jgi:nucleotide-binding universal stress UspA family protein